MVMAKAKTLKQEIYEEIEEIDQLGQDSEIKAVKLIQEKQKESDHEESEKSALLWEKLHKAKEKTFTYKEALLSHMKLLKDTYTEEIPSGYQWWIIPTEKGIVLSVRTREGKWFAKGIQVCGDPKYDINAVERLIWKALEFIDSLEQTQEQKGLIL